MEEHHLSDSVLLEAPNWIGADELLLNGDGILWRYSISGRALEPFDIPGLPFLNNDHVPGSDGDTVFVSACDWHIYRVSMSSLDFVRVTENNLEKPLLHFLHGVSPASDELAFVGISPKDDNIWGQADIYRMSLSDGALTQITNSSAPDDGPEYSPDGEWLYFNTEMFSTREGHAQIARIPVNGGAIEQLTHDDRVNWFPHLSSTGEFASYLSYPTGTMGHPADLAVEVKIVHGNSWNKANTVAYINGGQGTINVNSWSSNGDSFAFISYPE